MKHRAITRRWLVFYLANWYAFALAGVLMSLQPGDGRWLYELPWTSWGTQVAEALAGGEPVSGGALWILMGATLASVGVVASLVVSLAWLSDRGDTSTTQRAARRPAATPADSHAVPLSPQAREAVDLVEDPRVRSLIQQLQARLG